MQWVFLPMTAACTQILNMPRKLLREYDIQVANNEIAFQSWRALPDMALLSIKYHEKDACGFWH